VQDDAVLNDFLYVALQFSLVRLDLNGGTKWQTISTFPPSELFSVHALDSTLYVSIFSDLLLYKSTDGKTWEKVSTEGCNNLPLGAFLGMEDTSFTDGDTTVSGIVFGTQFGPWFYRVS
jgi:hypothetical protein